MFSDADAAALYDVLNPWTAGDPEADFCTAAVMAAGAVLDVGCGTGSLLHRARELGHTGRLVGLDPDETMLALARSRADVEWATGAAADARWEQEFDLATMTSNAFQCLIADDELRRSLLAIRAGLRTGGRFVFGTRHLPAREWQTWRPDNGYDVATADGRRLRMWHDVEAVTGDVVTLTETTAEPDGTVLRVDRARLRFHVLPDLADRLTDAGFAVEAYGDWRRGPVTATSRELVIVAHARRSSAGQPVR